MPKEETKLTVLEPADAASVAAEAESAVETAAADVEAPTGQPEPVSREEFDQLKAERERIEFREYATGNVVEQFLPVLDNFELALKSAGTEGQLRSGVGLIVKQMEEILRQLQVNPVTTVGEAFDPRLHEALGSVEREDMPDQHVAEEIRRGYKLRDRLLRPALVRVVSNPKQTSE